MPFNRGLEFMFWIAFFLPALPVTLGWILLLDPSYGLVNSALDTFGLGPLNIYSFWGIVWVHVAGSSIAAKVMLLTPAFRMLDASFEEASRISGAGTFTTIRRIVAPSLTPVIAVVLLLSIIHALQWFEVEAILGPPFRFSVFSTQIFSLIRRAVPDYPAAMAIGTVMLAALAPLILLQRWVSRRRSYTTLGARFTPQKHRLGRWRVPAFILLVVVALTVTVVPVSLLVVGTFMKLFGFFSIPEPWTVSHWQEVLRDPIFLDSVVDTLIVGFGTVAVGVTMFTVVAYVLVRSRFRGGAALEFISWLPSVLPGIILGVGILRFFVAVPLVQALYGTTLVLIAAISITTLTTGTQITKASLTQLGVELEEAARVGGGAWHQVIRRIVLPLITPSLLAVAAMTFIAGASDVSTTVLLATSDTRTLALLQLNLMIVGSYERAAVVGVVVVALTTGIAILARWMGLRVAVQDEAGVRQEVADR
jgi:iron(III) transport system permease protein